LGDTNSAKRVDRSYGNFGHANVGFARIGKSLSGMQGLWQNGETRDVFANFAQANDASFHRGCLTWIDYFSTQ